MSERPAKLTKEERSWILYDVANSAFVLIIITTVMPIFFSSIATAEPGALSPSRATSVWGYTNALASLLIAVLAPVLGTFADFQGAKKRLFLGFLAVGIVMTVLFATIGEGMWQYAVVLSVVGFMAYAGSNLFYDSFLTDVTTTEQLDAVSSQGFAWGYIGATVPFLVALAFIMFPDSVGGTLNATRLAFLITALWWLGFSVPLIRHVHQAHFIPRVPNPVRSAFARLFDTFRHIRRYRKAFVFLIAYFFYIDGVDTIIKMATIYGTEIGLDQTMLILAVLMIQIVAFPFALLYGRMAKRVGTRPMLFVGIAVYTVVVAVGFFLPVIQSQMVQQRVFWLMAVLVATSQGGIQALSRSYFGSLIPKERAGEFFGFYNIFGKFAAIIGPAMLAVMARWTGESRYGVLSLVVLFAAGALLLSRVRRHDEPAV